METIYSHSHKGLTIEIRNGYSSPKFDNNNLILYTFFNTWESYQKVDICLSDKLVKVTTFSSHGISSIYLVYDYDVWNRRGFKDMSVIKNLEIVGEKILKKEERHNVALDFGRSKSGKEIIVSLSDSIREHFSVVSDDLYRFRNWDQTKDVYFIQNATKLTIGAGQEVLEEFVEFLAEKGFHTESLSLQEQLMKGLFSKVEIVLDFKERFKKKKK